MKTSASKVESLSLTGGGEQSEKSLFLDGPKPQCFPVCWPHTFSMWQGNNVSKFIEQVILCVWNLIKLDFLTFNCDVLKIYQYFIIL